MYGLYLYMLCIVLLCKYVCMYVCRYKALRIKHSLNFSWNLFGKSHEPLKCDILKPMQIDCCNLPLFVCMVGM